MNKMILILGMAVGIYACSGNAPKKEATAEQPATTAETGNPAYDPERGTGKFTNVTVSPTLDKPLAEAPEE